MRSNEFSGKLFHVSNFVFRNVVIYFGKQRPFCKGRKNSFWAILHIYSLNKNCYLWKVVFFTSFITRILCISDTYAVSCCFSYAIYPACSAGCLGQEPSRLITNSRQTSTNPLANCSYSGFETFRLSQKHQYLVH